MNGFLEIALLCVIVVLLWANLRRRAFRRVELGAEFDAVLAKAEAAIPDFFEAKAVLALAKELGENLDVLASLDQSADNLVAATYLYSMNARQKSVRALEDELRISEERDYADVPSLRRRIGELHQQIDGFHQAIRDRNFKIRSVK